jgi:hypothetical protein
MSLSFINFNGKKILLAEYCKCKTEDEMLKLLEEAAAFYRNSAVKIVSLSDFTGTFVSTRFMTQAKHFGETSFSPKSEKMAIVGIDGIKKILLQAYNTVVKNKIVPFSSKEKALEYLTSR